MSIENPFISAVREFHFACRYSHSNSPSIDDAERRDLWAKLIGEETEELLAALSASDLINVADGIGDVIYVCVGAALAFGLPIEDIFREIHRSNMSKMGSEGKVERRADGKILRGESYTPPDISRILQAKKSR